MSTEAQLNDLVSELRGLLAKRPPARILEDLSRGTYLFGAGRWGRQVAAAMKAAGTPCLGFLDNREGLAEIDGHPVFHPSSFPRSLSEGRTLAISIVNSIVDDYAPLARELGFSCFVPHVELPDALGPSTNNAYLGRRANMVEHVDRIRKVIAEMGDPASQQVVLDLLRYRATGRHAATFSYDDKNQYLPTDLPSFDGPITFVDGGAFDGDTFRFLRSRGVEVEEWIAFEPDAANFAALVKAARQAATRAVLFPCGLSDAFQHVLFEDARGTESRVVADASASSTTVPCVALDDVMPGVQADFIKLDLEGAEAAALRGMTKTVQRCESRLAVSAYHQQEDLWAIPEQLIALLPDATIHVRQHTRWGTETVVYALPKRKAPARHRAATSSP